MYRKMTLVGIYQMAIINIPIKSVAHVYTRAILVRAMYALKCATGIYIVRVRRQGGRGFVPVGWQA